MTSLNQIIAKSCVLGPGNSTAGICAPAGSITSFFLLSFKDSCRNAYAGELHDVSEPRFSQLLGEPQDLSELEGSQQLSHMCCPGPLASTQNQGKWLAGSSLALHLNAQKLPHVRCRMNIPAQRAEIQNILHRDTSWSGQFPWQFVPRWSRLQSTSNCEVQVCAVTDANLCEWYDVPACCHCVMRLSVTVWWCQVVMPVLPAFELKCARGYRQGYMQEHSAIQSQLHLSRPDCARTVTPGSVPVSAWLHRACGLGTNHHCQLWLANWNQRILDMQSWKQSHRAICMLPNECCYKKKINIDTSDIDILYFENIASTSFIYMIQKNMIDIVETQCQYCRRQKWYQIINVYSICLESRNHCDARLASGSWMEMAQSRWLYRILPF